MAAHDHHFEYDASSNRSYSAVRIFHDGIISRFSEDTLVTLFRDEIQKQLSDDPDLRLLIREMVGEAIRKMNLQEVVAAAVKASLRVGEVGE